MTSACSVACRCRGSVLASLAVIIVILSGSTLSLRILSFFPQCRWKWLVPRSGPRCAVSRQMARVRHACMPRENLRFVTYNIKGFGSGFWPEGKDPAEVAAAYERICADLLQLHPDVLCLNEVVRFPLTDAGGRQRGDSLDALAADLGDMQVHFAHATPGFERFGNAVLTNANLEILDTVSAHLKGGTVVKTKDGRDKQIVRCALAVRFQAQTRFPQLSKLGVICTHLDHISSLERQRQVDDICQFQKTWCNDVPHLLLGDLNALKRTDYSSKEWQAVAAKHEATGWEPPQDCPSLCLLQQEGYEDLLEKSLLGPGNTTNSLAEIPASRKMTASTKEPDIRIDHVFSCAKLSKIIHGRSISSALHTPGARTWIHTEAQGSDHFPLVVDLCT